MTVTVLALYEPAEPCQGGRARRRRGADPDDADLARCRFARRCLHIRRHRRIPYGDPAIARFPADIAQTNNDPSVRWVDHLGDIKNGSSTCSDEYFQRIKTDFDLFQDPLVYTIGDNEWTDCHRPNNGPYDPLERLAKGPPGVLRPARPDPRPARGACGPARHHQPSRPAGTHVD